MGGLFAAAMRGGAMARSGGGGARARIISAPSGLVVPPAVSRGAGAGGAGAGGASSGGGGRELSCVELVSFTNITGGPRRRGLFQRACSDCALLQSVRRLRGLGGQSYRH
jgi:hypothetical protein